MIIPKPFSRASAFFGDPIYVPRDISDEDFEKWQQLLTEKLNEATDRAESFGYPAERQSQQLG